MPPMNQPRKITWPVMAFILGGMTALFLVMLWVWTRG